MTRQKIFNGVLIGLLMLGLGLTAVPALAESGLPPRNPVAADGGDSDDRSPLGTYIELAAPGQAGAWSVVQWQDSTDAWHDVEGWRGALDERGERRWWVAAKDFGTGPFRWTVGNNVSIPFNLPAGAGQTVIVETGQK